MFTEDDIFSAHILIVDDRADNVALLNQALQAAGHTRISAAADATQVCAMHLQHRYDLILLDLQMPGMDGFDLMAQLRIDGAEAYLPILVMTSESEQKARALLAGAKDFVSKPFDLVEVKTRIYNMLEMRMLYRRLGDAREVIETTVAERTAALRESEARYRGLAELAADWYWEQDENGQFSTVSGPVMHILGNMEGDLTGEAVGWDQAERSALREAISARRPFLDFVFNRRLADGSHKRFQVSGEPMFDLGSRFIGYRGVGVELGVNP